MEPYKKRRERLPRPRDFGDVGHYTTADRWYSYLINMWIPRQPDSIELMQLFIDCGLDAIQFCKIVMEQAQEAGGDAPTD